MRAIERWQSMKFINENEREHYEERAAIMEYDGGLSRANAELQARLAVMKARTK